MAHNANPQIHLALHRMRERSIYHNRFSATQYFVESFRSKIRQKRKQIETEQKKNENKTKRKWITNKRFRTEKKSTELRPGGHVIFIKCSSAPRFKIIITILCRLRGDCQQFRLAIGLGPLSPGHCLFRGRIECRRASSVSGTKTITPNAQLVITTSDCGRTSRIVAVLFESTQEYR